LGILTCSANRRDAALDDHQCTAAILIGLGINITAQGRPCGLWGNRPENTLGCCLEIHGLPGKLAKSGKFLKAFFFLGFNLAIQASVK